MATLGVSFGLVACLLVLVLSFCFATEFSVSGSLNSAHPSVPYGLSLTSGLALGNGWGLHLTSGTTESLQTTPKSPASQAG